MANENRAKEPFQFYTSSSLVEITGKRAKDLRSLLQILKTIDESSVFYHVHNSFKEYTFASGEYSNDFARWVQEDIEESGLAEKLASINVKDFVDIESLRSQIVKVIEEYLKTNPVEISVPAGREFYFLTSISIVMPTPYKAYTLKDFEAALKNIGPRSLYYHFFDARIRIGNKTNDFSKWIRANFNENELADKIEALDPYFMTLNELKDKIIVLCRKKEKSQGIMKSLFDFVLGGFNK